MKKILVLFIFINLNLLAQNDNEKDPATSFPEYYFGTSLGLNLSNVIEKPDIIDPSFGIAYSLGVNGEHFLWDKSSNSILYSLNLVQRKIDFGMINISDSKGNISKAESDERSNYISLAVSFKGDLYHFSRPTSEHLVRSGINRLYYRAGIYIGYLYNVFGTTGSNDFEVDANLFNRFDAGLDIAVGFQKKIANYLISLEYNYQQGLINKIENSDMFLNYTHSVNFLFQIPI